MTLQELLGIGPFAAIHMDPPSKFRVFKDPEPNTPGDRSAARHYAVMKLKDIAAFPVKQLAAKDCHLFMWSSAPFLFAHMNMLRGWGFRYSSIAFTWVKLKEGMDPEQFTVAHLAEEDLHVGMGLTTRKNTEIVILGRRGSPKRLSKKVRELILAPVREHSRKPDEIYQRIEEYCPGPYLDLFSRENHKGWTAFGFEAGKFDRAPICDSIPTNGVIEASTDSFRGSIPSTTAPRS
jgi:N6-adenosine-specific RNA methylase IME4